MKKEVYIIFCDLAIVACVALELHSQGFFKGDSFSEFFKRLLCISFQREELWIVHYYFAFAKHVATKNSSVYNFFIFIEPGNRNGKCVFQW